MRISQLPTLATLRGGAASSERQMLTLAVFFWIRLPTPERALTLKKLIKHIIHVCEKCFTSDAMSSKPRHCRSFSFCSRSHISGSSWARLSWPDHGRSSSTVWVAAWDCWPRTLRWTVARWHKGYFGLETRKGKQRKKKRISGVVLYITVTMTISTECIWLFYIFVVRLTFSPP